MDEDGILTIAEGASQVTYVYNVGQSKSAVFALEPRKVIGSERILRYLVGLEAFTEREEKFADVNGNGVIDTRDAVLALRRGKES